MQKGEPMRLIDALELKRSISVSAIIEDGKHIFDIIDEQPTVEPERETGRWIRKKVKHYCPRDDWSPDCDWDVIEGSWNQKEGSYYKYEYGFCSECGEHSYSRGDFCPLCGSYNGGLDESTDIS